MRTFDTTRDEFTPYGFEIDRWVPIQNTRPDRHDEIEIAVLDSGELTWLVGGHPTTVRANDLVMFWAALPHQMLGAKGVSHVHVITVPLDWVLQWQLPEELLTPVLQGRIVSDANDTEPIDDTCLFARWQREIDSGAKDLHEAVILELRSRLLRLAHWMKPEGSCSFSDTDAVLEERRVCMEKSEVMACYVARNYRSRIRVQDIADTVDLHPDYATTLFRKTFGLTLNALITRHRIAHAQHELISTEKPILAIAFDSGFDTLRRFNRAFKQRTGMAPSQYRKSRRAHMG